jgi:serine/threonine-protein kinase
MRQWPGVALDDPNDRTVVQRYDPLVGAILDGKYRLEFRLASGGFGAIYRAREVATNRELAIKIVHARLASDRGVAARFRREGQTLTTLESPHTIKAYEVGETDDGTLYIAMELLHGTNLFERFRTYGPVPWQVMVSIAIGVCHSLAEAHRLGIVHRDLKPTNIHLEKVGNDDNFAKVLDFGIAKIMQSSTLDSSDLTTAGLMIGTLDYMSPEQILGAEITVATDIYTLGIVMFEMISGKRPFATANTPAAALAAALEAPPPLSSLVPVPAELDRIVWTCLKGEPTQRYQDASELATALGRMRARALQQQKQSNDATTVMQMSFDEGNTLRGVAAPPRRPSMAAVSQQPPAGGPAPPRPRFDLDRYAAREARIQWILWAIAFAIVGAIIAFIIGWL